MEVSLVNVQNPLLSWRFDSIYLKNFLTDNLISHAFIDILQHSAQVWGKYTVLVFILQNYLLRLQNLLIVGKPDSVIAFKFYLDSS